MFISTKFILFYIFNFKGFLASKQRFFFLHTITISTYLHCYSPMKAAEQIKIWTTFVILRPS